ncbi:hypothetical protein HY375_00630 [Candidatus Berkelbacteria bacterium]|nr:hypothetical protein [Candidatus Berkelbacteria bacterium]
MPKTTPRPHTFEEFDGRLREHVRELARKRGLDTGGEFDQAWATTGSLNGERGLCFKLAWVRKLSGEILWDSSLRTRDVLCMLHGEEGLVEFEENLARELAEELPLEVIEQFDTRPELLAQIRLHAQAGAAAVFAAMEGPRDPGAAVAESGTGSNAEA